MLVCPVFVQPSDWVRREGGRAGYGGGGGGVTAEVRSDCCSDVGWRWWSRFEYQDGGSPWKEEGERRPLF